MKSGMEHGQPDGHSSDLDNAETGDSPAATGTPSGPPAFDFTAFESPAPPTYAAPPAFPLPAFTTPADPAAPRPTTPPSFEAPLPQVPSLQVPQGRHSAPFDALEDEAARAEVPHDAIPEAPDDVFPLTVEIPDELDAQALADIEALELAQSIVDPSYDPNAGKPTADVAPGSNEWFGGLTKTDVPLDVDEEPVAPDPIIQIPGRNRIEGYLTWMVANNGSDLHISAGEIPRCRIFGSLRQIKGAPRLTQDDMETLVAEVLTDKQALVFAQTNETDTAYAMNEADGATLTSRFRVNVFVSMDTFGMVCRVIPTRIKTLDELGILPQIKKLAQLPRGLVLVTGPTGSGKSTTMAALIDLINTTREESIFTFEDPIEFTHTSKKALIKHREVGTDTESFPAGLKAVRREDPDIILIGEMRDNETIKAAIEAADTGHYVLATLHTSSAYETVGRIINTFPEAEQNQIRVTLASILKAVICQTLVPSASAEMGRVVASEVMMVSPGIQNNIRENDLPAIRNALSDETQGSISLDSHLARLIQEGKITKREALKKASSAKNLNRQLGDTSDGGV
jgi:twitching motility protein PilT